MAVVVNIVVIETVNKIFVWAFIYYLVLYTMFFCFSCIIIYYKLSHLKLEIPIKG